MKKRNSGFTLVEIVICVVILFIVSLIGFLGANRYMKISRQNFDKQTCKQLEDDFSAAFQDKQLPYQRKSGGEEVPYVYVGYISKHIVDGEETLWFEKSYTFGPDTNSVGDYELSKGFKAYPKEPFEIIIQHESGVDLTHLNTSLSKTKNRMFVVVKVDEFGFATSLKTIIMHRTFVLSLGNLRAIGKYCYPEIDITGCGSTGSSFRKYVCWDGENANWECKTVRPD